MAFLWSNQRQLRTWNRSAVNIWRGYTLFPNRDKKCNFLKEMCEIIMANYVHRLGRKICENRFLTQRRRNKTSEHMIHWQSSLLLAVRSYCHGDSAQSSSLHSAVLTFWKSYLKHENRIWARSVCFIVSIWVTVCVFVAGATFHSFCLWLNAVQVIIIGLKNE